MDTHTPAGNIASSVQTLLGCSQQSKWMWDHQGRKGEWGEGGKRREGHNGKGKGREGGKKKGERKGKGKGRIPSFKYKHFGGY